MGLRKGPKRAKGAAVDAGRHVLYYGDNLEVLRERRPELAIKDESVDLCYMDPPFNSKRNYNQIYRNIGEDRAQAQAFIDTWKWDDHAISAHRRILANDEGRYAPALVALIRGLHGVLKEGSLFAYLVGMAARVSEIRRVLKQTGSFYFHCDSTASHYLKLVCDAVFCSQGGDFQNEIIWKRTSAHSSSLRYGPVHDVLLFYTKSDEFYWNQLYTPHDPKYLESHYNQTDSAGRRWTSSDLTAAGTRQGSSGRMWRGFDVAAKGNHWKFSIENLERLDKEGRIHWPAKKDGWPRFRRYLDEMPGLPIQDVWTDINPVNAKAAERMGYPTQKPIALLGRIIESSCPPDGVVFDPCCGCGTTIAAAEKLGRRWVGIDITYQSVSLVLKRLEDQVGPEKWATLDLQINRTGIPQDLASAVALANKRDDRVRKEFEKWAVLTYTNNRAVINEKKGADAGIDGRVYFVTGPSENATMVLQVKSGGVGRGDIAKLHSDMIREKAAMATLITLEDPTAPMISEAKSAGQYHHDLMDRDYDKIRIVTVNQIIHDHLRLDIPLARI